MPYLALKLSNKFKESLKDILRLRSILTIPKVNELILWVNLVVTTVFWFLYHLLRMISRMWLMLLGMN